MGKKKQGGSFKNGLRGESKAAIVISWTQKKKSPSSKKGGQIGGCWEKTKLKDALLSDQVIGKKIPSFCENAASLRRMRGTIVWGIYLVDSEA